jgi:hypothetical protein
MKRNEHTFQFTGEQIGNAAKAEYDYHRERLVWWRKEQEAAIEKAKSAGVDVREYEHTGGKSVQMVFDPALTARIDECSRKINSHRAAADRFQIEGSAYSTQPGRTYELHPDDVVYFRLAGGARED